MMFPVSTLRTALLLLSALASSSSSSSSSSLCTTPPDGSRSFTSSLMSAVYTPSSGTSGSFSPTSLRQAFFMVGQGAGPTDASEIRSTLKTCSADDTPFSDLAAPIVGLEQESDDFTLTIANALYVDEAFPINPTYQTDLETYWGAEATTVDFVNEPTDAKNSINDFVSDSTRGIIPSILESDPSPDTVLMLINAMYLKAKWAQPFDGAWPQQFSDPERDGDSASSMVQTMSKIMVAPYVNGGTYTAVSLPYSEEGYEMLLIRPGGCTRPTSGQAVHLSHLINTCLDSTLNDAMTQVMTNDSTRVRVTMPKFHVTWRTDNTFKSTLKDLGLTKIFSANDADLSGISSDASQLFVSTVAHMADVKVDEQGTEAAAVTSIGISVTSMPVEPNVHFKADVPFVYAIWHRPTQEILFAGWVNVDALEVDVQSTVPGGDVEPKSAAATTSLLPVCSSSGPVCAAAESGGTDSGSGTDVEEQQGGQEKEEVVKDDPSPTTPPVTEEPKAGDGVEAAGAGDGTPSSASMMGAGGLGLWTAAAGAGAIVAKLLI